MRTVDSQWHWYPGAFFQDVATRQEFPRCEVVGDAYHLQIAPNEQLSFAIDECELESQLLIMDDHGIDAAIVSPGSLTVEAFQPIEDVRLAKVLNAEMSSAQSRYPSRIVGAATIPFTSPATAIGVLEHAVFDLDLRAVWIPSNVLGELIDVTEFEGFFRRMEQLSVVGVLHPVRTIMAEKLAKYGLEYVAGYPFDTSLAALTLVLSGVMERLPELKVVHPHLGGTLPYLAARIDREYKNPWAGNTPLPSPPSSYLRRFYTDTVSESREALALALDFYGVDHVLFGSDHPWWPIDAGIEFVRQNTRDGITGAILGRNATTLFGLA